MSRIWPTARNQWWSQVNHHSNDDDWQTNSTPTEATLINRYIDTISIGQNISYPDVSPIGAPKAYDFSGCSTLFCWEFWLHPIVLNDRIVDRNLFESAKKEHFSRHKICVLLFQLWNVLTDQTQRTTRWFWWWFSCWVVSRMQTLFAWVLYAACFRWRLTAVAKIIAYAVNSTDNGKLITFSLNQSADLIAFKWSSFGANKSNRKWCSATPEVNSSNVLTHFVHSCVSNLWWL